MKNLKKGWQMLIAIPSKGRAGLTTTQKIIKEYGTFYVPESEYHQYKNAVGKCNLIKVPKSIRGITQTRNWILKNSNEKWVVFIDDDVKSAGYTKLKERKTKKKDIKDAGFWYDQFIMFFDLVEQIGYKIWGVKTENSSRGVCPYKPILYKAYITASCMGIINDGKYLFDESYKVKEDYEICLRHIKNEGGILGIRYLHWENSHWEDEGGCKDYRTVEVEKQAVKKLIKQFPGMVSMAKRKANEFTIKLNL